MEADGLREDLRRLEGYLLQELAAEDQRLNEQLRAALAAGGKRLRPALVFLSARLCDPTIATEGLLPLAAAVEMAHTASLIHDDVIDESALRRGLPSLHTRLGPQAAVICGDYLFAKALSLLAQYRDPALTSLLSEAVGEMCVGEFYQLDSAFALERQTMAHYFRCVRRKTAALIVACCRMGALAGQGGAEAGQALSRFGEYFGLAFQLSDDLLDFTDNPACGKPRGQDLRQGVFTPPLLYALKHSPRADELTVLAQKREKSEAELEFLLQEVERCGGLADTQRLTQAFSQKAAAALSVFPDNGAKSALLALSAGLPNRER